MADKILIVDDDPAICKLLEKVMHSNEMETSTVNCGMDALSILKNHTFDLILMDEAGEVYVTEPIAEQFSSDFTVHVISQEGVS